MPPTETRSQSMAFLQQGPDPKRWFDPSEQEEIDPLTVLEDLLEDFKYRLSEFEKLAVKRVYKNPNFTLLDARQHRFMLHFLLYKADELAIGFHLLKRPAETAVDVAYLDDQIDRLEKIFQDWHGDVENDPNIPGEFKQAMRELKAGQTEEMEEDMFDPDAAPEA